MKPNTVVIGVRVSISLRKKLARLANKDSRALSDWIRLRLLEVVAKTK